MKSVRMTWLLVAGALAVAACSTTSAPAGPPGVENFGKTQSPPPQGVNDAGVPSILDFTAPQLGGGEVRGADHAGRDVALWFWAPW